MRRMLLRSPAFARDLRAWLKSRRGWPHRSRRRSRSCRLTRRTRPCGRTNCVDRCRLLVVQQGTTPHRIRVCAARGAGGDSPGSVGHARSGLLIPTWPVQQRTRSAPSYSITDKIVMILRIREARGYGPHSLRLTFSDGTTKQVNVHPLLDGPIFEPLQDPPISRAGPWTRSAARSFGPMAGLRSGGPLRVGGRTDVRGQGSVSGIDSGGILNERRSPMLLEYIQAALRHAEYEILPDDGSYYGAIPECNGVYANAEALEDCRDELREVLEGWVLVRLHGNLPLPSIDELC